MFDYSLVDKTVDILVKRFSPKMVIVFGSVARKEADEFSDIDILVVMDSDEPQYKRPVDLYIAVANIRVPKDIIVLTPKEFEQNVANRYSFTSKIVRTGTVMYEA